MKKVKMVVGRVQFYDPRVHGVNATLLSRWKACRHRALLDLNGWTPRLVSVGGIYGQVVHSALQHVYDHVRIGKLKSYQGIKDKDYATVLDHAFVSWKNENPRASAEVIQKLEMVRLLAETVLPLYFRYHAKDFTDMQWGPPEQPFKLPYRVDVPGFGIVETFLKGRIDGSFTRPDVKKACLTLLETKTKSRVDPGSLVDMLPHDMQVSIYLKAMVLAGQQPNALLYNVVRRPGFQQGAKETLPDLATRIIKDIKKRPEFYFLRFRMDLSKNDLARQSAEVDAIVIDFIRWWAGEVAHYKNSDWCENKYGRCEFLGTLCGGPDEGKPNPARFYKRKTPFRQGEDDLV
jgi:hypothetical protein